MWKIAKFSRKYQLELVGQSLKAKFGFGTSGPEGSVANLVSEIVEESRHEEETRRRDFFAQNLYKMYLFEQARENTLQKLEKKLTVSAINSPQPLKDILIAHQIANKRGFDEDQLAMSLGFLAKTNQALGEHRRNYQDLDVSC
jgi:hypothetical protein